MADKVTFSPSEFEQVPLDYVITAPLMATINAHKLAAGTTLEYIKTLADDKNSQTFTQKVSMTNPADGKTVESSRTIKVPALALTKVPNLSFDSMSVDFEYAISQVYNENKKTDANASLDFSLPGFLKVFGNIGFKGGVTTSKSVENTINKSGTLKVKVHLSENDYPEGLRKVIDWLTQGVEHQIAK